MMRSLHHRLALGLAVSLVLLAGAQWLVAGFAVERLLKQQMAQRLEHDAEDLLAALAPDTKGSLQLDADRIGGTYRRPFSGHYYEIHVGSAASPAFTSRSLWDAALPAGSGENGSYQTTGPQQQPLLVLVRHYERHGQAVKIAVAEDLSGLNAGLATLRRLYGALTAAVVLLVLLVQAWTVQRSLAPLGELRRQLGALERGERERLDAPVPDEIAPLVTQLNELLALLVRRSRRSREALGNLAHALKTRLAVLVQAGEHPAVQGDAELRQLLGDTTEAMGAIVARELRRARIEGSPHPGQRSGVAAAAERLVHILPKLHGDKALHIDQHVEANLALAMDGEDLTELLGNLLDNACTWCRGTVRLDAARHDGEVRLVIEDDGPGCAPDALPRIGKRGWRADESRPGSGLGLAIVGDLVDGWGGRVEFDPSPALGGLRVTVRLPGNLYRNTDQGGLP